MQCSKTLHNRQNTRQSSHYITQGQLHNPILTAAGHCPFHLIGRHLPLAADVCAALWEMDNRQEMTGQASRYNSKHLLCEESV